MQLFYTTDIHGDTATLGEVETRHCTKVLRKKIGDQIQFIDGKGTLYTATISSISKRDCQVLIIDRKAIQKWNGHIHIAIAPTKNISRMEWFVEKCTEIGVDEISLIRCDHSERKNVRLDRLEKVALSATKQSLKAHLPIIHELTSYKDFIGGVKDASNLKLICWVDENNRHLLQHSKSDENILILIGPEGDFSPNEIELAKEVGFLSTGLGDSRLRTETAGIVACQLAHLFLDAT